MKESDGREEELECVKEQITNNNKIGDARTTGVAKHQTRNKSTSSTTENSLQSKERKKTYSTHFLVSVLVSDTDTSGNNNLRETGNTSKSDKSQYTRDERALRSTNSNIFTLRTA